MRLISKVFVSLVLLKLTASANKFQDESERTDFASNQLYDPQLTEAVGKASPQESIIEKRWFWECKLFSYNPIKEGCCKGVVYAKKTHACCDSKVILKIDCDGKAYNPCKEGCCVGEDHSHVYSKSIKKCCRGIVEWKLFSSCGSLIHG